MATVRLKLRELAEGQGMNMSQVQRRSGLTMGMVRRYWYNQTTTVALKELGKLAELLGVKPGSLLTDETESTEDKHAPAKGTGKRTHGKKRAS